LCPHCGGEGCDQCDGGQIQVTIPDGDVWVETCDTCGREHGGSFVGSGGPRPCILTEGCPGTTKWEKVNMEGTR